MWFLLPMVAFGQVELCELRSPADVDAQIELADAALERADLPGARTELELSRDAARCLSEPIDPLQLSRLAWLHAEFGVFDQDLDKTWRWVRLAQDVAPDAPPPERIGIDHPLRRFLPEAPELPPVEGPERVIAHPKKGGVYMDGTRLDAAEARRATPHLLQVFANKELVDSWWQSGPRFKTEYLIVGEPEPEPEVGPDKWKPAKKNTIEAWEKWIGKNPDSEWLDEARRRLDQVRYEEAIAAGQQGIKAYLRDDPGPNKRNARAALEKIRFDRAASEGTRQAWSLFLAKHPKGFYSTEAEERLDEMSWEKFRTEDTEEAYVRYLTQHRDGAHRDEARELLAMRVFEAAVKSEDPRKLKAFTARFAASPLVPRAQALLAGTHFDAVQLALGGLEDFTALEAGLRKKLEPQGVRVERVDFPERVVNRDLPAGNGLVWISVTERAEGLHAEAQLWAPVGSGPLMSWRANAPTASSLVSAILKGVPELAAFED